MIFEVLVNMIQKTNIDPIKWWRPDWNAVSCANCLRDGLKQQPMINCKEEEEEKEKLKQSSCLAILANHSV